MPSNCLDLQTVSTTLTTFATLSIITFNKPNKQNKEAVRKSDGYLIGKIKTRSFPDSLLVCVTILKVTEETRTYVRINQANKVETSEIDDIKSNYVYTF